MHLRIYPIFNTPRGILRNYASMHLPYIQYPLRYLAEVCIYASMHLPYIQHPLRYLEEVCIYASIIHTIVCVCVCLVVSVCGFVVVVCVRVCDLCRLSQEIHDTRTPTTNLAYESTLGLPTKHVYCVASFDYRLPMRRPRCLSQLTVHTPAVFRS